MKSQADKRRSERVFSVGDKVFLKLQPYVQSSVVRRTNHKLGFKYFGPFSVLERIGEVAYRLDLPESSRVHPVFHESQLKPSIGPGHKVLPQLPISDSLFQVPVRVLQKRVPQQGHQTVVQVLVQWSGSSEEMATWEDLETLRQQFPRASAWDKQNFKRKGMSTTWMGRCDASWLQVKRWAVEPGPRGPGSCQAGWRATTWARRSPCNA